MSAPACTLWGMVDSILEFLSLIAAIVGLWMLTHAMCATSSARESPGRAVAFGAGFNALGVFLGAYLVATLPVGQDLPFTAWTFGIGGLIGVGLGALSSYRSNRRKARA